MTTDSPIPQADLADVAEQRQEAFAPAADEDAVALGRGGPPIDANEADVVEQRIDASSLIDEDVDEP